MRRIFHPSFAPVALATAALLIVGLCVPALADQEPSGGFDLKSVVTAVAPSVVRVYAENRGSDGKVNMIRQASGVILSADGFVITQNSIIIDREHVFIRTTSDVRIPARVILRDPDTDTAMLKVEATGLKPVALGRIDSVIPGQAVLHIGNAYGLAIGKSDDLSVSRGVVNSVHPLDSARKSYAGKVIQTDVDFSPGGFGGALVNLKGELIGIAGAVVTSRSTNTEVSVAIPVDDVQLKLEKAMLSLTTAAKPPTPAPTPASKTTPKTTPAPAPETPTSPRTPENASPGYLGAYLLEETSGTRGAFIDKVVPGSPAEQAGLRAGDLVTSVDGHPVKNGGEFLDALDKAVEAQVLKLAIDRQGARSNIDVKLGKAPTRVLR